MQLPSMLQGDSLSRLVKGAIAGAATTIVIGFSWGGWTLGGTVDKIAMERSDTAVVAVLAPVCVINFRQAADAPAQLIALKKESSWMQDSFVKKGGWATFTGLRDGLENAVAKACADTLTRDATAAQ